MNRDNRQNFDHGLKLEADGFRLLCKRLDTVARSLETIARKEQAKRAQRAVTLSEYNDEADIQDAYGYGFITDDERRQLLEQLESGRQYVEETQTKASIALSLLRDFISRLNQQAASYEFELLPPEQQIEHLNAAEKMRERAESRRAARNIVF